MHARPLFALILAVTLSMAVASTPQTVNELEFLGSYRWNERERSFGGLSGLELGEDGLTLMAISDRAHFLTARIIREDGRITGVADTIITPLLNRRGQRYRKYLGDSEGLAAGADAGVLISFEGAHMVARYPDYSAPPDKIMRSPEFRNLEKNGSLEALAINGSGEIFTLPEGETGDRDTIPVFRYRNGSWDQPFSLPRHGYFLPVGADFGPDGMFYLLERQFTSLFGFRSRIRRFSIGLDTISGGEILLETAAGRHGNLEGLSVWRDAHGAIRLTMVSDDNFNPFQTTQLVEYRLP